jgi:hypothetical protein
MFVMSLVRKMNPTHDTGGTRERERESKTMRLRALGFCGADDSVSPEHLAVIARAYPSVEFGVLFRPDREGRPRYASPSWVERLGRVAAAAAARDGAAAAGTNGNGMRLAAHLCGTRVNDVLEGKEEGIDFLARLERLGFRRVQINATAANGVDTSLLAESVPIFACVAEEHPDLEFILQKNEETGPLCEGLLEFFAGEWPANVSMLLDESMGAGVSPSSWPPPPAEYPVGYAGGIGPRNVRQVLQEIQKVAAGRTVWIDMESSLRSIKNDLDVFDLDKCYEVIETVRDMGLIDRPDFLR